MKRITFLILILLLSINCWGQTTPSFPISSSTSAYSFTGTLGDENQLRIVTYIWGQVQSPGLYIVPDDTDLITLLSLAHGPTEDAKLTKVRIVRSGMEMEKNEIIHVNLEDFLDTGDRNLIPELKAGDTVVVPATVFYGMERVAGFLSKFATVLSMYNLYLSITQD